LVTEPTGSGTNSCSISISVLLFLFFYCETTHRSEHSHFSSVSYLGAALSLATSRCYVSDNSSHSIYFTFKF